MMKCRYKKYFSGLIGEFCAKAGLKSCRNLMKLKR